MQKIFLLIDEEQKGPFSEEEVREMYVAGKITPETLHWSENMSEWQVLGPRNHETGEPVPIRKTIAPPRRQQNPGSKRRYEIERKPLAPEDQEVDDLSLRSKPVTLPKALGIMILFFLLLTLMIKGTSHMIADPAKKFSAWVDKLSNPR